MSAALAPIEVKHQGRNGERGGVAPRSSRKRADSTQWTRRELCGSPAFERAAAGDQSAKLIAADRGRGRSASARRRWPGEMVARKMPGRWQRPGTARFDRG